MPSSRPGSTILATLFLILGALALAGCGAQLESEKSGGSNFDKSEWNQGETRGVPIVAKPTTEKGPEDPDGLLVNIDEVVHPFLREVRREGPDHAVVIFDVGEAIKLELVDLRELVLIEGNPEFVHVRVRSQHFRFEKKR